MAQKLSKMEKSLNGFKILGLVVTVNLKKKAIPSFKAMVKSVEIGLSDPNVIFVRCDQTEFFPSDQQEFTCPVSDVAQADFEDEDFLKKVNKK